MPDTSAQVRAPLNPPAPGSERPRYQHDCGHCHFLGQFACSSQVYDLYAHTDGHLPTVIARFGDDGPDYLSGASSSYGSSPELTEARRRAQARGLWDYDVKAALHYTSADSEACQQELRAALPFTLEYQAFLAFERGDQPRHEGLVLHLLDLSFAHEKRYSENPSKTSALAQVQQNISRVVACYRGLSDYEAIFVKKLGDVVEFAWPAVLEDAALAA